MPLKWWGAAAALWTASAAAVNTEKFQIPYFGMAAEYLLTDHQRAADGGLGYQLSLGVPLDDPRNAVELRFSDAGYQRHSDGGDNYQTTLFVDYVRDFGALGDPEGFFTGIKPFASLGLGFVQDDVKASKHAHLGFAGGAGLLVPVGHRGLAARLEVRAQDTRTLVDDVVSLGVQVPMGWFYDRPVTLPAAEECPVAVVDAETGRRDCVQDSDGDGVRDTLDQCPGTPAGSAVDANGCTRAPEAGDADQDGVPDSRDHCPGTPPGLSVDDQGCVVAQTTSLRGVTFLANASTLTDEGRATLDLVAETLQLQPNLKVEIAGHTDSVGSDTFNTLLSQERADAVRAYLVGKGVEEGRMKAVGYGELEPISPNDTEEGRRANRRVEFRISTE